MTPLESWRGSEARPEEPAERTGTVEGLWAKPGHPSRGTSDNERIRGRTWVRRPQINKVVACSWLGDGLGRKHRLLDRPGVGSGLGPVKVAGSGSGTDTVAGCSAGSMAGAGSGSGSVAGMGFISGSVEVWG